VVKFISRLPFVNARVLRFVKFLLNAVPVFGIFFLQGWTYYVFIVIWNFSQLLEGHLKSGGIFFVIYHTIAILTMWSFVRAVFSRPPFQIEKQYFYEHSRVNEEEDDERFCKSCQQPKPQRAHHCSWCERCVAKMDHHCPWLGNCVGAHNYKFFVLLLTYGLIMSLFVGITMTFFTTTLQVKKAPILFTLAAIGLAVAIGTGILLSFHLFLLFSNKTTIECGIDMASCQKERTYDRGWKQNFISVMGEDPFLWFFPVRPPLPVILREREPLSESVEVVKL